MTLSFDRVIEFCDGWTPIVGTNTAVVAEKIAILHKRAEDAGRDPKQISVSLARYCAEPDRRMVDELEKIGVERVVNTVPSANKETLLPLLDKYAVLIF